MAIIEFVDRDVAAKRVDRKKRIQQKIHLKIHLKLKKRTKKQRKYKS